MNILYTICGRAGSKGVKNKNVKEMLGVPLVYYTLAAIQESAAELPAGSIYHVVINTDSTDLAKLAQAQKAVPVEVLWRDASLAGDTVPKVSVIKDCYRRSAKAHSIAYDVVVDLDITSPLRTARDIRQAIDRKIERPDTDVVYSVTGARRNPYFNMVKEEDGFFVKAVASNFTTRQEAPVFYDMNASIYAYSPRALEEKDANTFFNNGASAIIMRDTAVLDIDSEEDYELMGVVARYFFDKYQEFGAIYRAAALLKQGAAR